MGGVKFLGAAFALLLEAAMIWVYAGTGRMFELNGVARVCVGVVATAGVIALWMVFAAPMSARRLAMPQLLWFKVAVCGVAAGIVGRTHSLRLCAIFVAFSVLSLTLEYLAA